MTAISTRSSGVPIHRPRGVRSGLRRITVRTTSGGGAPGSVRRYGDDASRAPQAARTTGPRAARGRRGRPSAPGGRSGCRRWGCCSSVVAEVAVCAPLCSWWLGLRAWATVLAGRPYGQGGRSRRRRRPPAARTGVRRLAVLGALAVRGRPSRAVTCVLRGRCGSGRRYAGDSWRVVLCAAARHVGGAGARRPGGSPRTRSPPGTPRPAAAGATATNARAAGAERAFGAVRRRQSRHAGVRAAVRRSPPASPPRTPCP